MMNFILYLMEFQKEYWTAETPCAFEIFLVILVCVKTCPNLSAQVLNIRCLDPLFQFAQVLLQFWTLSHVFGRFFTMLPLNMPVHVEPGAPGIHEEFWFLNIIIDKIKTNFPLGTSLESLLLKT